MWSIFISHSITTRRWARPISYAYPEAAPPDLTAPVSPSAMRAAVYEMPWREAGVVLRREDLAVVCRIGRYIFGIVRVDLECVLCIICTQYRIDKLMHDVKRLRFGNYCNSHALTVITEQQGSNQL